MATMVLETSIFILIDVAIKVAVQVFARLVCHVVQEGKQKIIFQLNHLDALPLECHGSVQALECISIHERVNGGREAVYSTCIIEKV